MRRRYVGAAALTVAAASAVLPATAATKKTSGTVTIGVTEMLTGSSAFYGKAALDGIQVAADEINAAGGILGKKVVLKIQDNASDNAQAASIMRKYAQDKTMAAAIPPTYQPNFEAACAVAAQFKIPIVAAQSGEPTAKSNSTGYCYTVTTDASDQMAKTFKYMTDKKGSKTFVSVYDQKNGYVSFMRPFMADVVKAGGYKLVEIAVESGQSDFGPQISKVLEEKADAVFPFMATEDAARFMQQSRAKGLTATFFDPISQLTSRRISSLSGGTANGLVGSTPQSEGDNPKWAAFVQAYQKKINAPVDDPTYSGFGYDAMKLIAQAMTDAKTTTDRAKIKAQLDKYTKTCLSICYSNGGKGAFVASDLYFVKLTDKGFEPDK